MKNILIILSIFFCFKMYSQNCTNSTGRILELVRNGSFEDYTEKAFDQGQIQFASPWLQVPNINSTVDYRHKDFTCPSPQPNLLSCVQRAKLFSNGDYSIEGLSNNQQPKSGKAFAMIQVITPTPSMAVACSPQSLPGEYLMQELAQPLLAGRTYNAKMFVNLADKAHIAAKGLSMFFTKEIPKNNGSFNCPLTINPTIKIVKPEAITDKDNWTEIFGSFVAEGGEKFLTIGVLDPSPSKVVDLGSIFGQTWGTAYYLIDDVSLTLDLCTQPDLRNNKPITMTVCKYNSQTQQTTCTTKAASSMVAGDFNNAAVVPKTPWGSPLKR